jgi:hypothetical protein
MAVKVLNQYGQRTVTVHYKNIVRFHYFFLGTIVQVDSCCCTFQKHHFTLAIFFLERITPGALWVRTKNSE